MSQIWNVQVRSLEHTFPLSAKNQNYLTHIWEQAFKAEGITASHFRNEITIDYA